jgi:predicted permease
LSKWACGVPAVISSVSDRDPAALREMKRLGLKPGVAITVEAGTRNASLRVRIGDRAGFSALESGRQAPTAFGRGALESDGWADGRHPAHHTGRTVMLAARVRSWLDATLLRSRMEREMDAELRLHMEHHAEHLIRGGLSAAEARRQARLEFGGFEQTKEACRDARGAGLLEDLLRDLSFGLRMMRKNPWFSAVAVLTLALGIGATTAVFSLVNAVLLRALPYKDPQNLVFLFEPNYHFTDVPIEAFSPFNADFYDLKRQSASFAAFALFTIDGMKLSMDGAAVRVGGSRVTGEFFRVLGISPELGRTVDADDDQPGRGQVAVISHAMWQSRFGSDRGVLGKNLLLDDRPFRIVGVMPPGFAFPHGRESIETVDKTTDVWVPWAMTPQERASREDSQGNAIGRLRPGVSPAQAQAETGPIVGRLDPLHPVPFQGARAVIRPIDVSITGDSRPVLLLFMGAVVLVLLIACSNVASLVMARANARALEMSVRTALGAPRLRLIRQLLAESLCLAGAGAITGMLAAFAAIRLLIRFHPVSIPRLEETSIDGRVLLFTIGASFATALFCGLLPALPASRCKLNDALKSSGGRTVKGPAGRLHRWLTIAEIALTFVLLTGSGLLIRSYLKLMSVDKGFAASSTVTMRVQLDERYDNQPARQTEFLRRLIDKTSSLPGVEAAGAINILPLGGGESIVLLQVEGHPFDEKISFEGRAITPRYFAAMGIPLLEGRAFTDADATGRPLVAIVSRSFARKYFPGQSAVGKRVRSRESSSPWSTIVGVVNDVRYRGLDTTPPMQFYGPLVNLDSVDLVARTSLPVDPMASSMRAVVRDLDPALVPGDIRTMDQLVSQATAERRFQTFLLTAFGGAALFLSLVGLYALMAYSVERRTGEFGIRTALGAHQPRRADRPSQQRLIFAVLLYSAAEKRSGSELRRPARNQQRHARRELGVPRQNLREMLLLQFDRRQIDQREQSREQQREPDAARRRRQPERSDQRAQIERISREGVRSRRRQPLVLREMPGRPCAQRQSAGRERQPRLPARKVGMREPGERGHHYEPGGDSQTRHSGPRKAWETSAAASGQLCEPART